MNASATQPQTWDEYLEFVMNTPIKMIISKSKDYNQVKTVREWLNGDETVLTSAKDNLMRMVNTVTELNNRRKAAGLEPVKVDVRSMLTEAIAVGIGANNYWYHDYVNGADNLFTLTGKEEWIGNGSTYEKESMKGWWDDEKDSNGGHYKWFSDQYGKLYAIAPYMYTKVGPNQRQGVGKDKVPTFYSGAGLEIISWSNTSRAYSDKNHAIPLYPPREATDDAKMKAYMTEENGYYTEERFREIATNWVNKVVPQQLQTELNNAKAAIAAKKAEKVQAEQKLANINKAIEEVTKTIAAEQAKIDNAANAIQAANTNKTAAVHKKTEAEQKLAQLEQMAANATTEAQQLATQISTLESNLATKNSALANGKQALEQFNETNKKFNQLTAEKNALVSDKNAKQAELNKVIADLADNAAKLADVQSKINAKNGEIATKAFEVTNKQNAITSAEADKAAKETLVNNQAQLVEDQKKLVEQAKQLLDSQKNINNRVNQINNELPTLDPTIYDADIAAHRNDLTAANATLATKSSVANVENGKLAAFRADYNARSSSDYATINTLGQHEAEYNVLMNKLNVILNQLNQLNGTKADLENDSQVVANNIYLLNKAKEGFKAILANLEYLDNQDKQKNPNQSTKESDKKNKDSKNKEDKPKDSKKDSKEQENKQSTSENTSGNSEEKESGINPLLVAGGTVLAVSGGYVIYLVGKKKKKEEE